MIVRLPDPGPADICEGCGEEKPLFVICGAEHDHVHVCGSCLVLAALSQSPGSREEHGS